MRGPWNLSKISCLIVEDNPHMRAILRSILSGFGVRSIYEASEGTEALELVVDRKPDVILCDWEMKPFSGADFLQILRRDPDPIVHTTPVLIISAHARRAVIMEALNIGIHGFVAKPVAPAILYKHIGDVLQRQDIHGRCKGITLHGEPVCQNEETGNLAGIMPKVEPEPATGALALL